MGDRPLFSTTTTRTSHVGQPGYDNEEIWIRFIKRYEPKLRRLAESRLPQRRDMIDDVIQSLYCNILNNPTLLSYDPTETRFRTVLVKHFFNLFVNSIRALKTGPKSNYIEKATPLLKTTELPEYEHRRLKLLTIDMVARNYANLDYDMGRFGPEPKYWDRVIWKDHYIEHLSRPAIARKYGKTLSFVREAYKRANKRIQKDAEILLTSTGLL